MTEATFIILDVGPSDARAVTASRAAASTGCVLHTFCSSGPPGARCAPPLTNGLEVLLDELFKVLPRARANVWLH